MSSRSLISAHERLDELDKQMVAIQTEVRLQFKEVFTKTKRLEAVLIGTSGAIILMLITILMRLS
tara:strand:- start:70 stop:264 length:195 start_codon:yes stop_codon:yes gene_type:complete